jgi:hypothetical protein
MQLSNYIYDIECVPNFFSIRFTRWEDGAKWCFEISDWVNQGQALFLFLTQVQQSGGRMVGYNNEFYDYPMVHLIMDYNGIINNGILYNKSQSIINAENPYEHNIWPNNRYIPQVDLLKIHHFDNAAKRTSLKLLEFNMRLPNIHELQFGWNRPFTREECDETLVYNDSDVFATGKFYEYSKKAIAFRDELSKKYNEDFTNYNDTKIGEKFFVMELAKKGIKAHKNIQTHRSSIKVADVLIPEIKFETQGFQEVLEFFRQTVINPEQIKGFFGSRDKSKTKCTANITERLAQTMNPDDVMVHYNDGSKSTYAKIDRSKSVKYLRPVNIHTVVNGFRFDFGAGGIHGSLHNTVVVPPAGYTLRDSDVASYYPNLSIANNFFPLHLTEVFCAVYLGIYKQRKTYGKGTPENGMLKLALNGVYGKSNDKHSPFYDPQYTMSITINGQLLLCMLAEQLMKIPNLKLVQINTDGLTYVCPDEYLPHADAINDWWEQLTKLELEHVDYLKMAIRDVNNYLAVTKPYTDRDGILQPPKIKRIGAYAHERAAENDGTRELPWHKNQSAIVVAKAAEAALVRGDNIERFIREHLAVDPMDFMLRTKVNRSDWLYLETPVKWGDTVVTTKREKMQNVSRYFVSNSGGRLIKEMLPTDKQVKEWGLKRHWKHIDTGSIKQANKAPSGKWVECKPPTSKPPIRRNGISAGQNVTVCNNLEGVDINVLISDVNIDFYVKETRKLVDSLLNNAEK